MSLIPRIYHFFIIKAHLSQAVEQSYLAIKQKVGGGDSSLAYHWRRFCYRKLYEQANTLGEQGLVYQREAEKSVVAAVFPDGLPQGVYSFPIVSYWFLQASVIFKSQSADINPLYAEIVQKSAVEYHAELGKLSEATREMILLYEKELLDRIKADPVFVGNYV